MIEGPEGVQEISIGADKFQKGELIHPIPFAPNSKKKIAANGAWVSDAEYLLRIYFYESPARLNYTFNFEEDGLTWDIKMEHALFGRRDIDSMIGKKE